MLNRSVLLQAKVGYKKLFFLCLSLFCFNVAWADCVPSNKTPTIVFSDVIAQADVPVGTVLATASTSYTLRCNRDGITNDKDWTWYVHFSPNNFSAGSPIAGLSNVVPTSTPGIGLRWINWTSNVGDGMMTSRPLNDASQGRGISASNGTGTTTSLRDTFELIKTGDIQTGPQLTVIPDIAMWRRSILNSIVLSGDLYVLTFTPFNLTNASCTIDQSNINVFLGSVNQNVFAGVNSTSKSVPFSVDLTCMKGTRVNITLSNLNAVAGFTGTIKVEGATPAKGVGIQITNGNDAPVRLGVREFITTAVAEKVSIPLKARYIQTEAKIVPGSANGVLVFTIDYI